MIFLLLLFYVFGVYLNFYFLWESKDYVWCEIIGKMIVYNECLVTLWYLICQNNVTSSQLRNMLHLILANFHFQNASIMNEWACQIPKKKFIRLLITFWKLKPYSSGYMSLTTWISMTLDVIWIHLDLCVYSTLPSNSI